MTDAYDKLNSKLAINKEITIHMKTQQQENLWEMQSFPIKFKVDALYNDLYALSANAGTNIGQSVATQGHPLQTGQTHTNYEETWCIYNCPQGTKEKIMAMPGAISLGTLHPDNSKDDYVWQKFQINTSSKTTTTQHIDHIWNLQLFKDLEHYTATHQDKHQHFTFEHSNYEHSVGT